MVDNNDEEEYEEEYEIECEDDDDEFHDLQEENEQLQSILLNTAKASFAVNFEINRENQVRLDPEHYIAIDTIEGKSDLDKIKRILIGKYSIRYILQTFAELDLFKEYPNAESLVTIQYAIAEDKTPLLIIEKGENRAFLSPGIEVDLE